MRDASRRVPDLPPAFMAARAADFAASLPLRPFRAALAEADAAGLMHHTATRVRVSRGGYLWYEWLGGGRGARVRAPRDAAAATAPRAAT